MMLDFGPFRRSGAVLAGALFSVLAATQLTAAASGDAWEEFRQDVETACLAQAASVITVSDVFVDPFGSESYGYAVMVGIGVGTTTGYMVVCAYDKQSQLAEISGQFDL